MLACIRYCRTESKFSTHSGGWVPQGRGIVARKGVVVTFMSIRRVEEFSLSFAKG
jgi:hypothetical protein